MVFLIHRFGSADRFRNRSAHAESMKAPAFMYNMAKHAMSTTYIESSATPHLYRYVGNEAAEPHNPRTNDSHWELSLHSF